MIEEFIKALEIQNASEKINVCKPDETSKKKYKFIERKVNDRMYNLIVQTFANYDHRLVNNLHYIADINHINDNIFNFSRNLYSAGTKVNDLLGGYLKNFFDVNLPNSVVINDIKYSKKQFGFDYFYINDNLKENVFIDISETHKIIKIQCTQIGGIFVPSKKGRRFFILAEGTLYNEGINAPIYFNVNKNPSIWNMTPDEIIILASMKTLARSAKVDTTVLQNMKSIYNEKMTNKLLSLE